jgi:hypothetical protein
MVPKGLEINRQYPYSVRVVVRGGADVVAFGSPFVIADSELKSAIEQAIGSSGLFRSVVQSGSADFVLSARVVALNKRFYGTDLDLEIGWSLVRVDDGRMMMRRGIITSASTRNRTESGPAMKSAIAQAARENVAQALRLAADSDL